MNQTERAKRIERLKATMREVVRCLIDGKVDVDIDAKVENTMFHSHRILGSGSVQTMIEVFHRLKDEPHALDMRRAALNADEEQRLQVIANAVVIGKLAERIRQLEAARETWPMTRLAVVDERDTIDRLERLEATVLEQHDRIERLKAVLQQWLALDDEPRAIPLLDVGAWNMIFAHRDLDFDDEST